MGRIFCRALSYSLHTKIQMSEMQHLIYKSTNDEYSQHTQRLRTEQLLVARRHID